MGPIDAACTLCKQQKRKCSLMSTLSLLGTLVGHREAQKDPLYVFSQPSQSTILNTYADVIRKRDLTTRRMLDVDSAKESDGDARRVKRAKTQSGAPSGANLKGGQVKENPQYQYVGAFPFFASIPFCADVQLLTPLLISVHPKPLSNLLGTPNSEHRSTSVSRSRAKAPHMVQENHSNTSVLGPFQLPSFSRLSDDLTGREATRTAFTTGQSNANSSGPMRRNVLVYPEASRPNQKDKAATSVSTRGKYGFKPIPSTFVAHAPAANRKHRYIDLIHVNSYRCVTLFCYPLC